MAAYAQRMTLVVGLKTDSSIVIGTDSRIVDGGGVFFDRFKKLYCFNTHSISLAGDTGNAASVILGCKSMLENARDVEDVFAAIAEGGRKLLEVTAKPATYAFVVAGWSRNVGLSLHTLFSNDGLTPQLRPTYAACGAESGFHLSRSRFSQLYSSDMAEAKAKRLVAFAITECMSVDTTVGGVLQMAVIRGRGEVEQLTPEDCEEHAKWAAQKTSEFTRHFFASPTVLIGK